MSALKRTLRLKSRPVFVFRSNTVQAPEVAKSATTTTATTVTTVATTSMVC